MGGSLFCFCNLDSTHCESMVLPETITLLEETSAPVAFLASLFWAVPAVFWKNIVRGGRFGWNRLTMIAPGFCFRGCKRPVSLKVGGRRTVADSGSSSSELSTTTGPFPTNSRSGISFSSDYAINLAIR